MVLIQIPENFKRRSPPPQPPGLTFEDLLPEILRPLPSEKERLKYSINLHICISGVAI